jgi:hypothetical protein
MTEICAECGAAHEGGLSCADDFYILLGWENEFPPLGEVHHLTVLCYYLQHPSLYSPAGLAESRRLLGKFVAQGLTPPEVRREARNRVNSRNRTWKVSARPGQQGQYDQPTPWQMRAADIVAGGPEHYIENVRAWAEGIWQLVKGNA